MARYRSSSVASCTPNSSARVLVCHRRVVASLVAGHRMREATIAATRSRSAQGLVASSEAKPKRCMAKQTACTWANYFQVGSDSQAYRALDNYTAPRLRWWLRFKYKLRNRKGGTYPLSHLYGHFGLVRLSVRGREQAWVKA